MKCMSAEAKPTLNKILSKGLPDRRKRLIQKTNSGSKDEWTHESYISATNDIVLIQHF